MVELTLEVTKKTLLSMFSVIILGYFFEEIFYLGESRFQSLVVLSFFVYCAISLFSFSKHKLFYVISLPILTQFIHIFQKYSFTTGGNSAWRLFPFILLDMYFINFFIRKHIDISKHEKIFLISWIIINSLFLIISPNLVNIISGGIILYLMTLPLLFSYLNIISFADDFRLEIEKYLCLLFIILGLGTFGLIIAGAGYKGSDNLLATRNIADTNVTMAYFILLWPFAILYATRNHVLFLFKLILIAIFIGVVALSFSRGALLIVIPYMIMTTLMTRQFIYIKWLLPLVFVLIYYRSELYFFFQEQDLAYFWKLRFGDMVSISALLQKLDAASGRTQIHQIAYSLFLQNPLYGHGIGSFEVLGPGYREAHSMWYTLLAEQGILGVMYNYGIFVVLCASLMKRISYRTKCNNLLLVSILFYLLFNHTVGSVFVVLPGKSITINCIAPMILICIYFYVRSFANSNSSYNRSSFNSSSIQIK